MSGPEKGAKVLNEFISLGKEIAKLPVLPRYKKCAEDLYGICKRILDANENTSTWVNRFLYFDFRAQTARADFLTAVKKYNRMKTGTQRRQLKFNCGDIGNIYHRNLRNKIGHWFKSHRIKLQKAERIFNDLSRSDAIMVIFVEENIVKELDQVVLKMEKAVDANDLNKAENVRIQSKKSMRDVCDQMQSFNNEFTDLVIEFAAIAKVPITLVRK